MSLSSKGAPPFTEALATELLKIREVTFDDGIKCTCDDFSEIERCLHTELVRTHLDKLEEAVESFEEREERKKQKQKNQEKEKKRLKKE